MQAAEDAELKCLGEVKLVSVVAVDAMLKTRERKVASYLLSPLEDLPVKALREK